jgi:hypothetical protein
LNTAAEREGCHDCHGREVKEKISDVRVLASSPLYAFSSAVIPKKWQRLFISRRIGPAL